ncbi:MAG TPA: LPS assembly protein LptD [Methylomirabilota bacterium]|nr:LPS assembly protein LptD [Methylomirabilota bacterium]
MGTRLRGWILLAAGLLLAPGARAAAQTTPPQTPTAQTPVTLRTAGGDVTILADRMEQVGPDNLVIATGNVEITRGAARLMADRVELNRATGDAVAEGRVVFYDGEDQLTGQRIEYNLKTGTGVVYQADARAEPNYRITGERMDRLGESVYQIRKGMFTTCDDDPPTWSFRFDSANADFNDYVYGRNASFWVKNIPLIPIFPFFAAAIRRERQTGFLFPKVGNSSSKGFYLETPFFWAIDESKDATISPFFYTNRGEGLSAEFRYVASETDRGRAGLFFIQETARHDASRFTGSIRQDWTLGNRTWLKIDLNGVSDDNVIRDYGDTLRQISSQRVESNVFATKSWDTWNLVGDLFVYQDLTTRRPTELWRLPDISLVGTRQPLDPWTGVLFQSTNSFVHFVRDVGSSGSRLDIHPELSRPIPLAGYATLTPFLGARLTAYDRTVTGTHLSRLGGVIEDTTDEPRVRRLLEAGADLETKVSRVFQTNGWWGTDALLHTIEPRVRYGWIGSEDANQLPQWTTGVDDVRNTSVVQYSLTNRVRARSVSQANTEAIRWEMFRLTLANSYDTLRGRVGDAFSTVIVQPTPMLKFRSDVTYDPIAHTVPTATADVTVSQPFTSGSLGIRYSEPGKITFLQGALNTQLSRLVTVRSSINWDLRRERFTETRVAADFHWQCWALTIEYVNRAHRDDEIRFAVNLLGVGGPIGSSVGLGAIESSGQR